MSEKEPSPESVPSAVSASLHTIAQVLRDAKHLTPETQAALAELVDELGEAAQAGKASSEEVARLVESVAHVAESLREQPGSGTLSAARKRLERAIGFAETRAPFLAGLAQRLLDALVDLGI